ncbi:MAG: hypothetical protein M3Y37_02310 [Chloroflexota bacterium]|nr:hypothetical protein [Chloroflexota bacterium]
MQLLRRHRFLRSSLSVLAMLGVLLALVANIYTVPTANAQTASVTANVHLCDYDLTGLTVYEIAPLCGAQSAGNLVTLDNGSGIVLTQTTGSDGLASFTNLTPGISTFYLYTSRPDPYVGVVAGCRQDDYLGNPVFAYQLLPIGGLGDVNFYFAAQDNMVYCDFFLYIPGATPPTGGWTGDVTVNKHFCPEGYDGYSADIFDLAQNCQDDPQVVSFDLTDANGNTSTATTPGSGLNTAGWTGVPAGPVTITETGGEYGTPRVFCKNESLNGTGDPEVEVPVNGTTATTELKDGYEFLYCDWFNIQYDPGFVAIKIYKYACPDGYASNSYDELSQECNDPYDPITFHLNGASTGNPGSQETGEVIQGGVQWTGLEGDTWYITEFFDENFGEPIVFCKLISNDDLSESPLEQVPVETTDDGYRIVRDVADFYTLECYWFNVTEQPYVGIYLHKYGCPETHEEDWTREEFAQYCTTIVRDARFTVEAPDGTEYEQTLNGIDVWWERLAPGEYGISEQQPSAWTASVVYCAVGSYNGDTGSYERVDISSSNGFTWDLGGYEYIDCYWYNLPKPRPVVTVDPNAPATLIIVKYTCPEAYDPLATDADPTADCDELTDGIEFSVIGASNQSISGETGDDGEGTVAFDDLRAGSYLLRETWPADTENAFIWNCESDYRVFDYPFSPFARIDHTGTIKISLIAGETLECLWMNVPNPPEEDENGDGEVELTIAVYECPSGSFVASACDPASEGVGVSLLASSGEGEPIDFETDEDGVATGSVDADEYDVDADETICFADSDAFTPQGTLDLTSGEAVEVSIYLCG